MGTCIAACGEDEPVDGTADGTTDVAVDTTDVAVDTTADVAAETVADSAVEVDTAVVETTDTTVPDTSDTTVPDTSDTSDTTVPDTSDTSVPDTSDASDTSDGVIASGCGSADDCMNCAFGSKVTSPDECYCLFCASTPLTRSECADNQASWNALCDPWPRPDQQCPVAICLPGASPLCDAGGQCVADPNSCFFSEDCGTCRFDKPPTTAADCRCPTCGVPLANDSCEAVELAVSDVCAGFDYDACPLPPCMFPPPIVCSESIRTCGYGERVP